MVRLEYKQALYVSISKLLKDWHLTLRYYKIKTKNKMKMKMKIKGINKNEIIYSIQYNKFNLNQTLCFDASAIKPYLIIVSLRTELATRKLTHHLNVHFLPTGFDTCSMYTFYPQGFGTYKRLVAS